MRERVHQLRLRVLQPLWVVRLALSRRRIPPASGDSGLVVCLTSHPSRIRHAWIAIETIFRQRRVPDRIVLVLGEDKFASRTLPRMLVRQQRRGLEILWVPHDCGSFDKLVPLRVASPDAVIITVDDDAMYAPSVVARLTDYATDHPGTVVGNRGRVIQCDDAGLVPYLDWPLATPETPAERLVLTGVGGVLYPPGVLPIELLSDMDLATTLCPTNDDIWFWAVAGAAGVPTHCLGLESHQPVRRQAGTPRLETINRFQGEFDRQFAHVVEYFRSHFIRA